MYQNINGLKFLHKWDYNMCVLQLCVCIICVYIQNLLYYIYHITLYFVAIVI